MLAQEIHEMLVWQSQSRNLREYLSCVFLRCKGSVEFRVSGDLVMAKTVSIQLAKALEGMPVTVKVVPSEIFVWMCSIQLNENPVKMWRQIRSFLEKVLGIEFKHYLPKTFEKVGFDAAFKGLFRNLSAESELVLFYNPLLLCKEISDRLEAVERMHTMAQDQGQIERAKEMNVFAARFRALLSLTGDYLL